ncbi:MAG TPA: putative glycolipid-binding domain-containing protein [Actinocrinis sp.]|uniref:putative glycolipid-binding domain-containing protein n=2 Tax=Actinocrinis sp. TaxID=1920516 RepID=UPI002D2EF3CF|nr:putative glycolipid-binding domain-containing protein [Actinocrinis sp.]HZU54846.1 putative glycolipid-binding domain-containing protein [Actinocrinis sp.]
MDEQGRHLVWQVTETAGFEAAWLNLDGMILSATGRTVGQLPEPYWLTYTLQTDDRAATTRLQVTATTANAQYELDLRRDGGTWNVDGQPRADLAGALDCDLACSPVTNTMPIIRHGLQHGPGEHRFLMAFVQVPTLRVVASQQSYTHLGLTQDAARVRYASGTFVSDLTVDRDGLVIDYPTMAHRIPAGTTVTAEQRIGGPGSPRPSSSS